MKRIYDPAYLKLIENTKLQKKQEAKVYNYNLDDFEILPINSKRTSFRWRHKAWRVWLKGAHTLPETIEIVNKYIDECHKPYGKRQFNFVHLIQED